MPMGGSPRVEIPAKPGPVGLVVRDPSNPEVNRILDDRDHVAPWRLWGPYVTERQWGTVREDYSADGNAWDYLPHDHARSRAYRWGEDGIAGVSDFEQRLCLSLSLWNGRDPILKERFFGLTNNEGNHGEDIKELHWYLDATPSMSYLKMLYKYPQAEYPYAALVRENRARGRHEPEYELLDTGVLDDGRYFDVVVEYAKAGPEDLLMLVEAFNRGPDPADLWIVPQLFFRNTWNWEQNPLHPRLALTSAGTIVADHHTLGEYTLASDGRPQIVLCENETNVERLYGQPRDGRVFKDGVNDFVVGGRADAVRLEGSGTKAGIIHRATIPPGGSMRVKLRLAARIPRQPMSDFDAILDARCRESDRFYEFFADRVPDDDHRLVQRQAFAGLIWTRQYFNYDVRLWLDGDPTQPPPPASRLQGRNRHWRNFSTEYVLSIPDKWEYPWFASWDLSFHCVAFAGIDPEFAKKQIKRLLHDRAMHSSGEIPAYEWAFSDANPPVMPWAAWRVYQVDKRLMGRGDLHFLKQVFHRMLLNFTWWVNRKDSEGNNIFEGGFLGLDNIGVFDRSAPLPSGGHIQQSDGTSWMGMYCLNMLAIAMELAKENRAYSDVASKFFEHFVYIAHAINHLGDQQLQLWDEQDGFFYDALCLPDGQSQLLKVRSMVGLITLFAVETLEPEQVDALPGFKRRLEWFVENRPHLQQHLSARQRPGVPLRRLLAIVGRERLRRVLRPMLDEAEFLSPYGIRALSRYHLERPYQLELNGNQYRVDYEPAESRSGIFGGNSNWRGPIWFPVNYLIIESLQKFHYFYGDNYKVECPTGSGQMLSLWEVAAELSRRLCRLFLRDGEGRRPVNGGNPLFDGDPHWRNLVLFYEYFHGDDGRGLGASHQTGWTALVAKLLQQSGCGVL